MVELPVDTVFRYKGNLIEVVEENEEIYSCSSCYFFRGKTKMNRDDAHMCITFNCDSNERKDNKNVFFVEVAEPNAVII